MREMGGKPHWAKNFLYTDAGYIQQRYGRDLTDFLQVREECDPDGLFVGAWHRRALGEEQVGAQSCVEVETERGRLGGARGGWGDGMLWAGRRKMGGMGAYEEGEGEHPEDVDEAVIGRKDVGRGYGGAGGGDGTGNGTGSADDKTPTTSTSEESFDYMAKGEASVHLSPDKAEDLSGGGV